MKLLQQHKKIRLHDEGEPYRSWLHAEDTAQAVITIIESGVINEIFNIEGGFEQKNKDTVRKIVNSYFNGSYASEYKDINKLLDLSYQREGQDVRYSVDDSKLRKLGWKPEKSWVDFFHHLFWKNLILFLRTVIFLLRTRL